MSFKYDREKFISAKTIVLYAANVGAVANTTIAGAKGDGLKDCSNPVQSITAFIGEPDVLTSINKKTVEQIKEEVSKAYEKIHEFNQKMDEMVSIISEDIDPDLAEEIKKIEKEALKDYLNAGLAGGLLDTLQIYELIEKYKDDPELGLDDNQKLLLDFLAEEAKKTIEYNNMNGWEKFWAGAEVFVVSVVDGVIKVGELVVDGAVTLGGSAIGLGVYAIGGEEAGDQWLSGVTKIVDYDAADKVYDWYVDERGLNDIVAYGGVHTVGVAIGKVTGESLLTMIPGGKAAQIAVQACKSAGKTMDKSADLLDKSPGATEGEVNRARMGAAWGSAAISGTSTVATGAITDFAKAEVSAAPFEYGLGKYQLGLSGVRAAKTLGNAAVDYSVSGSQDGFGSYLGDHAGDYATELIGGAVGDHLKLHGEAAKITGVNSDKNWYAQANNAKNTYDKKINPVGKSIVGAVTEERETGFEPLKGFVDDIPMSDVGQKVFSKPNPRAGVDFPHSVS